ncbi:hypothetical protein ACHAXS_005320 [Conticribra weissflogii]
MHFFAVDPVLHGPSIPRLNEEPQFGRRIFASNDWIQHRLIPQQSGVPIFASEHLRKPRHKVAAPGSVVRNTIPAVVASASSLAEVVGDSFNGCECGFLISLSGPLFLCQLTLFQIRKN